MMVVISVWKAKAVFQFMALLSAHVRERRPAFCFCQKAALWCGCAGCALRRGKADLRRTAKMALAPGRPDRLVVRWVLGRCVVCRARQLLKTIHLLM